MQVRSRCLWLPAIVTALGVALVLWDSVKT
jgi:hypothetical protein